MRQCIVSGTVLFMLDLGLIRACELYHVEIMRAFVGVHRACYSWHGVCNTYNQFFDNIVSRFTLASLRISKHSEVN